MRQIFMNNHFQPISFYFYGLEQPIKAYLLRKLRFVYISTIFVTNIKFTAQGKSCLLKIFCVLCYWEKVTGRIFFKNDHANWIWCNKLLLLDLEWTKNPKRIFALTTRKEKSAKFKFAAHKSCGGMYAWVSELRMR